MKKNSSYLYFYSVAVGVCSGLVIIAYRILLKKIEHLRELFFLTPGKVWGIKDLSILLFLALSISSISYFLMNKYPLIAGGGVPVVKGVFSRKFRFNWFKDVFYKFFVGLLALGAGMSLGIEGPSIQLGAETGEGVLKRLKRPSSESGYFIACGASAGLAAAFNAPITGVIFVIEELVKHISPLLVTCTLTSAIVASWLSNDVFGLKPFFHFSTLEKFQLSHFYLIAIFCFFIALLGKLFFVGIMWAGKFLAKYQKNGFLKIFTAISISLVVSIYFYEITGGGHHLGEELIHRSFSIKYLLLLLIAKIIFTVYCSATGIPGGIFVPMISLGMIWGKLFGMIVIYFLGPRFNYTDYFVLMGMSSFLTAVVRAPITSTVLTMEVVGSFNHFFPLATATMFTMIFSDLFKMHPIYEVALEQLLHRRKKLNLDEKNEGLDRSDLEKTHISIPISIDSYLENRKIKEINWPKNFIISEIIRGESIIIPNGESVLFFGDILKGYTDILTAQEFGLELQKLGEEPHLEEESLSNDFETI